MNYEIYIIIITYNAMKWAEKCFSSLRKSSVPVKTIVVDNGSSDGTQDYIKNNYPEVDFIQSPENLGFGKANNLGIEKAYKQGADFFYLMNQDAWIFEDSFEKMLEVYDQYPNKEEIGIISPMHLDGTEQALDPHFERYCARSNEKNNFISDLYFQKPILWQEMTFVNAAHWLLPKKTVEVVGGFNPYFFHGAEDYDYVNRTVFHKKKILVSLKSKVVHDAKKARPQIDAKEAVRLKWESIRMQTETKYLNPNFNFNAAREKKAFITSMVKLGALGLTEDLKYTRSNYKFFNQKYVEIEGLRKKLISEPHVFLNL